MSESTEPCPVSDEQIGAALEALRSGRNLDPPLAEQKAAVERGDRAALVAQHVWLVVGIALKRTERDLGPRPDGDPARAATFDAALRRRIISGYPGLLEARDRWNPNRGYKFGSWASSWIRRRMDAARP